MRNPRAKQQIGNKTVKSAPQNRFFNRNMLAQKKKRDIAKKGAKRKTVPANEGRLTRHKKNGRKKKQNQRDYAIFFQQASPEEPF